jgi:SAM-dependent methyltransferase
VAGTDGGDAESPIFGRSTLPTPTRRAMAAPRFTLKGERVDKDEILTIYDPWYAENYDERFHGGDPWNDNLGAYKIELVGELLPPGGRWLDTGCGTGEHLAAFPDVERCGLDLSPHMLEKAAAKNPTATFVNGSYLDEHPEWVDSWDLVTNLWLSYQFVDSIKDVERAVRNMSSWVAPTGSLMMHVTDCEDVARGIQLPWEDPETPVFSDSLFITAVLWTWRESNGRVHKDLVAPQLQRMVNIVAQCFEEVEVRRWPSIAAGADRPKGVIGRKKRPAPISADEVGYTYPYTLTFPPRDHPREHWYDDEGDEQPDGEAPRVEQAEPAAQSEPAATPEPGRDLEPEVPAPPIANGQPAPGGTDVRLDTVPTRWVLIEASRRLSPVRRLKAIVRRTVG